MEEAVILMGEVLTHMGDKDPTRMEVDQVDMVDQE
jgi:hypothetical protein